MVFVRSLVLLLKFLFLYSLFSFTFTTCFPQIHPKCHGDESHALLQFKEGFVINNLAHGSPKIASWNSSTDCCSWDGIKCHERTDHVIHVDLRSSQIYGTMDANSSLFRLVHLRVLDLSDNDFNYSQIPSKIGELSQLKFLNLSRSLFSGEIPPQVSQLSKLLSLDLGFMATENLLQLKLSILKSIIQNSTKLEILFLSFVTISSTLPNTLTNLTSLKKLSLYNSELYGEFPVGVLHLPNLKILDLGYNPNLNGSLPEFQSSSLTNLLLDKTGFYGTLPVSIRNLSSLIILSVPHCHFSGYIPSSIGNLTQLTEIYLRDNKFRGDPSTSLANLNKLSVLAVGLNEFNIETIPLSFANLTQLHYLDATDCNIKGQIPSWIMNHSNLACLNLRSNFLHGKLELDTFLKLRKLVFLDLSFNKLSLYSGKSSSNMTDSRIQILQLDSCNLVEIPTYIRYLDDLESLMLSNNNITSLPNWLWKKASLKNLDVSQNSLTGEISPSICNLKSLMSLVIP
ncbi:receptor-like protein 7 [Medicago truncatula]|nr:receptor-like protein 7 [Medicago truncatula]AES77345.1 leucine-rich receptor-like kinase family protein, putative [Medicago truncatula]